MQLRIVGLSLDSRCSCSAAIDDVSRYRSKRESRNYHRIERAYGSFVRSFSLPRSVDPNRIVATYKNGILEIEIPKLEEAKPKQIQINA
jgi:HSP20 family protein